MKARLCVPYSFQQNDVKFDRNNVCFVNSPEKRPSVAFFAYLCTAFRREWAMCDWNPHNPQQHKRDGLCRHLRSEGGGSEMLAAPLFFCNGHLVRDKRVPSAARPNKTHAICQEYVSTTGCASARHINEAPFTIFVGSRCYGGLITGMWDDTQH